MKTIPSIAAALCAALVLAASPNASVPAPDQIDVSGFPKVQRERYAVFQARCSKCHSLARPLNASMRPEQWKVYIKKMSRRPGSGISSEAGEDIYEFLKFYGERRAAAVADAGAW